METPSQFHEGRMLRVFSKAGDKHAGLPLHEWIVRLAREKGMAGATARRCLRGFGASGEIHTSSIWSHSKDVPIVVEIVDRAERIESFVPLIRLAVGRGLVMVSELHVRFYQSPA